MAGSRARGLERVVIERLYVIADLWVTNVQTEANPLRLSQYIGLKCKQFSAERSVINSS